MKELSIEEKAKAYDEAIERAKRMFSEKEVNYLFHEFKESNDEKTKRILHSISNKISFHLRDIFTEEEFQCFDVWSNVWLKKHTDKPNNIYDKELSEILGCVIRRYINDPNISYAEREKVSKEIIPYVESLEKQGEHSNFLNKIQIGDKVTRNEDGVLVNLSQLNRIAKPTNEEQKDILEDAILDGNEDGLIAETIRYKKEKQGKQKPADKYKEWYDFIRWFVKQRTNNYSLIPSDIDIHKWGDNILNHARKVLEQNTVEWSEEDERILNDTFDILSSYYSYTDDVVLCDNINKTENWLKSIKERMKGE